MANRAYFVEEFVARELAQERWNIEDRDRLWMMAESGSSASLLYSYLSSRGYQGSYHSVANWREARFGSGSLAIEMNALAREARGLSTSDTLNLVTSWMVQIASRLFEETKRRKDLDKLSTKDLLFLLSLSTGKIQTIAVEADKIRSISDSRDLIFGVIEETRTVARQIYEEDAPESVPIVDNVLAIMKEKMNV